MNRKLETRRDFKSGDITMTGENFSVIVRANGHVTVTYPSRVVDVREDEHAHDEPSPRSSVIRRRGAR